MGDDAGRSDAPKSRLAGASDVLAGVRKFIVDVIVIAAVGGFVGYALFDAKFNQNIVIEEIGLPTKLQELGYTGQIASLRLWDALQHVNAQTRRHTDLEEETPLLAERRQIEITASDTGMSLSNLTDLVRQVLTSERRISGEFVCADLSCKEVRLLLRVVEDDEVFRIRGDNLRTDASPVALDAYFEKIGRQVLEVAHPILMGEYYNGKDNKKAKAILKEIVEEAPGKRSARRHEARAMTVLGQIFSDEYDYKGAREWLSKAIKASERHDPAMAGTALTLLGAVYEEEHKLDYEMDHKIDDEMEHKLDHAVRSWQKAIQTFASVQDRADGFFAGRWHAARATLGFPTYEHADSTLVLNWRGIAYEKLGNYLAAKADYWNLMKLHPDHIGGYIQLGTLLYAHGDSDAAAVFDDAVARFGSDASIYVAWGDALQLIDSMDLAKEKYREAAKLDTSVEHAPEIGMAAFNLGDHNFAASEFKRALLLRADDPIAAYGMGMLRREEGAYLEAIEHFNEAADGLPKWVYPVDGLAYTLRDLLRMDPVAACTCTSFPEHYASGKTETEKSRPRARKSLRRLRFCSGMGGFERVRSVRVYPLGYFASLIAAA